MWWPVNVWNCLKRKGKLNLLQHINWFRCPVYFPGVSEHFFSLYSDFPIAPSCLFPSSSPPVFFVSEFGPSLSNTNYTVSNSCISVSRSLIILFLFHLQILCSIILPLSLFRITPLLCTSPSPNLSTLNIHGPSCLSFFRYLYHGYLLQFLWFSFHINISVLYPSLFL